MLFQVGASQAATKRLASWVERQMVWNRGTVAVSMSCGCLAELLNLNSEVGESSSCSSSSSSSSRESECFTIRLTEQNNCTDNRGLSRHRTPMHRGRARRRGRERFPNFGIWVERRRGSRGVTKEVIGIHVLVTPQALAVQSCQMRPCTRANSETFAVTSVAPVRNAWAAIKRS